MEQFWWDETTRRAIVEKRPGWRENLELMKKEDPAWVFNNRQLAERPEDDEEIKNDPLSLMEVGEESVMVLFLELSVSDSRSWRMKRGHGGICLTLMEVGINPTLTLLRVNALSCSNLPTVEYMSFQIGLLVWTELRDWCRARTGGKEEYACRLLSSVVRRQQRTTSAPFTSL